MALLQYQVGEQLWMDGQLHEVTEEARTRWGSRTYRVRPADGGRARWYTPRSEGSLAAVIDRQSIRAFARGLRERVRADETLSPILGVQRAADEEAYLERAAHLWSALLLATSGSADEVAREHREGDDARAQHLQRWLDLVEQSLQETYAPAIVDHVLEQVRRTGGRLGDAVGGPSLTEAQARAPKPS